MLAQLAISLPDMESMAERIRMLRDARGLSPLQLAEAIGVTRALIWQWENGAVKNIRPENFIRLCHVLHVTPEFLIWGPDAPKPDELRSRRR